MGRLNVALGESGSGDLGRDALTKAGDSVNGAEREFAHGNNATQKIVEAVEVGFQFRGDLLKSVRAQQVAGSVVMALSRGPREFERFFTIARTGRGGHGQKLVGDLGQRAYTNDGALMQALTDDGCDTINGLGVLDGGAAELHHDHGSTCVTTAVFSCRRL